MGLREKSLNKVHEPLIEIINHFAYFTNRSHAPYFKLCLWYMAHGKKTILLLYNNICFPNKSEWEYVNVENGRLGFRPIYPPLTYPA